MEKKIISFYRFLFPNPFRITKTDFHNLWSQESRIECINISRNDQTMQMRTPLEIVGWFDYRTFLWIRLCHPQVVCVTKKVKISTMQGDDDIIDFHSFL